MTAASAESSVATAFRPVTGTEMFRPAGAESRTTGATSERNSAMVPDAKPDISGLPETDTGSRTEAGPRVGAAVFRSMEAEAPLQPSGAGIPPPETTAAQRGAGTVSGGRLRSSG